MSMSPEELLTGYNSWVTRKKVIGADISPGAFLHERYLEALRRAMVELYLDRMDLMSNYLDEEFHVRLAEDASHVNLESTDG